MFNDTIAQNKNEKLIATVTPQNIESNDISIQRVLNVKDRISVGGGTSRRYRKTELIPIVIYGHDMHKHKYHKLGVVSSRELLKLCKSGNLGSKLVSLVFEDGTEISTIARDVQTHPVNSAPMHVDFQKVNSGVPIKVFVHIKPINQDRCPGIKRGGVLNLSMHRIAVWCDPDHLVQNIMIDVSKLNIGGVISINDVKLPHGMYPFSNKNFAILSISGQETEVKDDQAEDKSDFDEKDK